MRRFGKGFVVGVCLVGLINSACGRDSEVGPPLNSANPPDASKKGQVQELTESLEALKKSKAPADQAQNSQQLSQNQITELITQIKELQAKIEDLQAKVKELEEMVTRIDAKTLPNIFAAIARLEREVGIGPIPAHPPGPEPGRTGLLAPSVPLPLSKRLVDRVEELEKKIESISNQNSIGRLVIRNYTGIVHTLRVNGVDHPIPAGETVLWVPVQPLQIYLPHGEWPKKYGLEYWRKTDQGYEFLLDIRPKSPPGTLINF